MNGTKAIWLIAIVLLGAAVALALLPAPSMTPSLRTELMRAEDIAVERRPAPVDAAASSEPTAGARPAAAAAGAPATAPAAAPSAAPTAAPTKPPRPAVVRSPDAVDLGMDQVIAHATVLAGNIVPKKDEKTGESYLLADDRYEIRGAGTEEEPYRVSWECLASASKTFLPRLNEFEIPQRVALLNGKWLRIDGFLTFPLMVAESKEVSIMLNQWDGCCIGVPPTAYDAIEVKLRTPAKRTSAHALFSYGGAKGKMRVDPYIEQRFLSGLYVLDDASLLTNIQPEF